MRLNSDQWAAAAIIAFAGVAFSLTFTFDEVPKAIQQGMGPERFPRLVCAVIVALAVTMAVLSRGRPEVALPKIDRAVVVVIAGALLFMAALWLAGLPVAMGLALVGLGVLWGERRWAALIANAILLPAVLWVAFVRGLKVPLPVGVAGQWLGF